MNTKQIARIPIIHYMAINGYSPVFVNETKAVYINPFREENSAGEDCHLIVDRISNTWHDSSTQTKGTLPELIAKTQHTDQLGVLLIVQSYTQNPR